MFVVADLPRPEALLEEVAFAAMAPIEPLRVEPQHAVHHPTQLRRRRHLDDHVEVRAEQRPCQELDSEHLRGAMEEYHERVAIFVVEEYESAAGSPRTDVEPAWRERAAGYARHGSEARRAFGGAPAIVTLSLQGLSLGPGR